MKILISICCLILSFFATSQSVDMYLFHDFNYAQLEKNEFKESDLSLLSLPSVKPESDYDLPQAGKRSCIILYPKDENGKSILFDASIEVSIDSLSKQSYDLIHTFLANGDQKSFIIIRLKPLEYKLLRTTVLQVRLNMSSKEYTSYFQYQPFPFFHETAIWKSRYNNNQPGTKTAWSHRLFADTWNPMYLGTIRGYNYQQTDDSSLPLRQEDGADGFMLTGNFSMPFTLLKGRDGQPTFRKTFSMYINPEFSWRIVNNTTSSPVVPLNTKAGLGLYKSFIISKEYKFEQRKRVTETLKFVDEKPFQSLVLDGQVMHYSNGQDSTVYYYDRIDSVKFPNIAFDTSRYSVDFKSGNFSTNYVKLGTVYNVLFHRLNTASLGAYYRREFHLDKAEYEKDQIKKYGYHRLEGFIQYKTSIRRAWWPFRTNNHHTNDHGKVTVPGLVQDQIRFDYEWILDDISNYNPNSKRDRPFSFSITYENQRLSHRTMGYFAKYYVGRDPLNIRYRLWVHYWTLGVTFRFPGSPDNKFFRDKALDKLEDHYSKYPCKGYLFPCWKSN